MICCGFSTNFDSCTFVQQATPRESYIKKLSLSIILSSSYGGVNDYGRVCNFLI